MKFNATIIGKLTVEADTVDEVDSKVDAALSAVTVTHDYRLKVRNTGDAPPKRERHQK